MYIKDKVIFLPMTGNIKVHEKDKRIFDMLQAELTLKTGKKMTQQELFSGIIEFARTKKETFFGRLFKLPLSEKEIKKIKSLQSDWGVITTEKDIDVTVYGIER
jgi:hypothetical protein